MTNAVLETMTHRRSIKRMKADPIPEEALNAILEAGLCAPSAGGQQSAIFVVSKDKAINEELGVLCAESGRRMSAKYWADRGGAPASLQQSAEKRNAFGDAPVAITLFAPRGWYNYTLDAACCAENMLLAADSLGVGACIKSFAPETFATPRGRELQKQWGVSDEYEAKLHVVLGYPDGEYPPAKPRKEGRIMAAKG